MRFTLVLSAFLAATAEALKVRAEDAANAFTIPKGGYKFTPGEFTTLTWAPTTHGTVTLKLQNFDDKDTVATKDGITLADAIPNGGSYNVQIPKDLDAGTYAIEIVDDQDSKNVNFTPKWKFNGLTQKAVDDDDDDDDDATTTGTATGSSALTTSGTATGRTASATGTTDATTTGTATSKGGVMTGASTASDATASSTASGFHTISAANSTTFQTTTTMSSTVSGRVLSHTRVLNATSLMTSASHSYTTTSGVSHTGRKHNMTAPRTTLSSSSTTLSTSTTARTTSATSATSTREAASTTAEHTAAETSAVSEVPDDSGAMLLKIPSLLLATVLCYALFL